MGLFEKLFKSIKVKSDEREERKISEEEAKFNSLDLEQQKTYINEILTNYNDNQLFKLISSKPYIYPRIIGSYPSYQLVDIVTKKGISVLDLVGKNPHLEDWYIVNQGALNQPDLIFSNLLPKKYKDMITDNTLIQLFESNPAVVLSDCVALKTTVKTKGIRKDGKEQIRHSTLKTQLLRAINLYMRPQIYKDNGFDDYAKAIADGIKGAEFVKNLEKMTSSLTTAANEVLSKSPEKAKSASACTLHNWNNRVAHKLPKLAKSEIKKEKALKSSKLGVAREKWYKLLCGLLSNPSINSFTEKEKISLVKDCVTASPEIYYDLSSLGLKDIAQKPIIQYSAYKTFKALKMHDEAKALLEYIGEKDSKKVIASTKAVASKKTSKKSAKVEEPKEKEVKEEMIFDRNKY